MLMTPQILKFVNFSKTQKFRYIEKEAKKLMRITITMKVGFTTKNSFTAEVTFQNRRKVKK